MKRIIIGAASLGILLAGCSSGSGGGGATVAETTETAPLVAIDTAVVQVDCGEDGVAGVTIEYGEKGGGEYTLGRNPTTKSIGGLDSLSRMYGLAEKTDTAELAVSVRPTTGTCETIITDYTSGDVLFERSSAGRTEVTVTVKGEEV